MHWYIKEPTRKRGAILFSFSSYDQQRTPFIICGVCIRHCEKNSQRKNAYVQRSGNARGKCTGVQSGGEYSQQKFRSRYSVSSCGTQRWKCGGLQPGHAKENGAPQRGRGTLKKEVRRSSPEGRAAEAPRLRRVHDDDEWRSVQMFCDAR